MTSSSSEAFLTRPRAAAGHRLRRGEEHMPVSKVTGDLPRIIANEERLYDGNLTFYFRILFFESRNLQNPYHNFRHMLHVLRLCQGMPLLPK